MAECSSLSTKWFVFSVHMAESLFFFFYDIHYLKLAALISKSNTHHSPDTYEEAQSI